MEKIVAAATRIRNSVMVGKRHEDSDRAREICFTPEQIIQTCVHGFWTNNHRFVDRIQGWDIAEKSGQIKDIEDNVAGRGYLVSEDLR